MIKWYSKTGCESSKATIMAYIECIFQNLLVSKKNNKYIIKAKKKDCLKKVKIKPKTFLPVHNNY